MPTDPCHGVKAPAQDTPVRLQQKLRVGAATAVRTSIVMSTYNAAQALAASLPLLFGLTTGPRTDLLVLFDASTDNSLQVVQGIMHARRHLAAPFSQVVVYESAWPLFEAAGETALMRRSNATHFFVSVQPDQQVHQLGWDVALQRPFEQYADTFAVSARCAHALVGGDAIGLCGSKGFTRPTPEQLATLGDRFWVRNTCNRGPLVLHAPRTRALGYFDHELYYQESSDHDLMCRAQRIGGFVVGYVAIDVASPSVHRTVVRENRHRTPAAAAMSRCATARLRVHSAGVQARRTGCFDEHRGRILPARGVRPLNRTAVEALPSGRVLNFTRLPLADDGYQKL